MYGLDIDIIKLEITPYAIPYNRYLNKNALMLTSGNPDHVNLVGLNVQHFWSYRRKLTFSTKLVLGGSTCYSNVGTPF